MTEKTSKSEMQYRQGDVFIRRIEKAPADLKPVPLDCGKIVLAHGEATGHMHAIDSGMGAALFMTPDQVKRVLRVKQPVRLYHDEHEPIEIPIGDYEVVIQKEYSPAEILNVAD